MNDPNSPAVCDPQASSYPELDRLLASRCNSQYTAAVVGIRAGTGTEFRSAHGICDPRTGRTAGSDTLFDLASVTKIVVAMLCVVLSEKGVMPLESRLSDILPGMREGPKKWVTIADTLAHSAGFSATPMPSLYSSELWRAGAPAVIRHLCEADLAYEPRTAVLYSCVGYMVLGHALETALGHSLDELIAAHITGPLGVETSLLFRPASSRSVAVTEYFRPKRGVTPPGVVHDGNAAALGGVSANAGLFGDVAGLLRLFDAFLDDTTAESLGITRGALLAMGHDRAVGDAVTWLGWRKREIEGRESVLWHTGFTGTSVLVDPESRSAVCVLTNSVHFSKYLSSAEHERAYLNALSRFRDEVHPLVGW